MLLKTLKNFDRLANKVMTVKAKESLYDYLSNNPKAGDVIPGTGGARKIRWENGMGKGSRGGVRVIYYYQVEEFILMITIYSKSDKSDFTKAECNELKKLLPSLINSVSWED